MQGEPGTAHEGREMQVQRRLAHQVAIVTGGGRGIGRAIALALGRQGAAVVVVSRTLSAAEETVAMLHTEGQRALAAATDVSNWPAVQELVMRTLKELGGLHILVNNAGTQGPIGPLVENNVAAWARTIQTNLVGTFVCCKAVLPHMVRQGYGRIVNLSGGGATAPRPNFSAYAASKAGVVRLTETLAAEVRAYGIQVNAVAPGAVNTRMLEEVLAAGWAAGEMSLAESRRQLESGGTPPELAAALVVFLSSGGCKGLTGKLIAAPFDAWQSWDADRIAELMAAPWLTLRRLDPLTLHSLERVRDCTIS